jgi:hypothetical protein
MKINNITSEIRDYANIILAIFTKISGVFEKKYVNVLYEKLPPQRRPMFVFLHVFLTVYITFVLTAPLYSSFSPLIICIDFFIASFIVYFMLIFFCLGFENVFIANRPSGKEIRPETVILFSSICLLVLSLSLLANFPGAKSPDTESQWQQVQQFDFNDWHPVIHTLFIWLASRVINHYAFVIFAQITTFSIGVGLLIAVLEKWGFSRKILLLTGGFIFLNPYTQNIMMFAWKDLALTICLTFISTMTIEIYMSNGLWLKKWRNLLFFIVLTGIASKIRHNGIFFTLPLVVLCFIFFFRGNKKTMLCPIGTVLIILFIRYPLYSILNVKFPKQVLRESVGIPMTIMGDIMVKNSQELPPNVKIFLNEIATDDEWKRKYSPGDYNSIKFSSNASSVINEMPPKEFFRLSLDAIKPSKMVALTAVRDATAIVWQIGGNINMFGVTNSANPGSNIIKRMLNYIFRGYNAVIRSIYPIACVFSKTGWYMLVLMLIGILSFYKDTVTCLILVVPSVAYNIGTMLLLAGKDIRFFHFNVVITLPLLLALLAEKKNCTGQTRPEAQKQQVLAVNEEPRSKLLGIFVG